MIEMKLVVKGEGETKVGVFFEVTKIEGESLLERRCARYLQDLILEAMEAQPGHTTSVVEEQKGASALYEELKRKAGI